MKKTEGIILRNKPLVEAIFELQWQLVKEEASNIKTDPHYKLTLGRIFDRLEKEYPYHEALPAAKMPDEIAGHVVQHRFRKSKDAWPLVQIGPGVLTVNDTEGYSWKNFEPRVKEAVTKLFDAYPNSKEGLRVESILLRYIDAIDFDFEKNDILKFLKEKMKTEMKLLSGLFIDTGVKESPLAIDWRFTFDSSNPRGSLNIRFARGERHKEQILMWETILKSTDDDIPKIPDNLGEWLNAAHELTSDWFFKIINGDLRKGFE